MGKVMTASKKRSAGQEKPKRRSPITRAEGERRLIEAARQLIQTKPYSEVGVRDIAELADVNHGFVHNWFGSKNGLLLAVVRQQFLEIAETVQKAEPGTPAINFLDPSVTAATRLVLWLDLEGVNTGGLFQDMPILDALTQRYIDIEGMNPAIARPAAIQAIAIGLGAGTFSPILGMTDHKDIMPVMALWRHIVGLLSKYPSA
jgi:AcrR family transcriptional regulator